MNSCHSKSFFFLFLIYLSHLRNFLEMDNSPELDGHHVAYLNILLGLDASSVLGPRSEKENLFTFIYTVLSTESSQG